MRDITFFFVAIIKVCLMPSFNFEFISWLLFVLVFIN